MLIVSQRQRDNLGIARAMWLKVPDDKVSTGLTNWRGNTYSDIAAAHDCDTIACFGGWCALTPEFQAQGVSVSEDGSPSLQDPFESVSMFLFGSFTMFNARLEHSNMYNFDKPRPSDWQIVMGRLEDHLENSKVS